MSHELEIMDDGSAAHAYAGDVPWHLMGKRVPADVTPEQMMQAAQLDWEVRKINAFIELAGKRTRINSCALVRSTDNVVLDVVTPDWNPVQNAEAFDFFNEFIMNGDMEMHTAGSLFGGRVVWALAKIKESFSLFGGKDQIDSYMLFTNPHQFGRSLSILETDIRVVCNNTLTQALRGAGTDAFRLTHRVKFDADRVKRIMGIAANQRGMYQDKAKFISTKSYEATAVLDYFKTLFPAGADAKKDISRNAKICYNLMDAQPGAELGEGTWWQAYNSSTYFIDHVIGRGNETRAQSAMYGYGAKKKLEALELAVEFAEKV